jgi:hypothetical protein
MIEKVLNTVFIIGVLEFKSVFKKPLKHPLFGVFFGSRE